MKVPFVYFTIPLALGITAANIFHAPLYILFILATTFAVMSFFTVKHKILSHISLYLAIFFLGAIFLTSGDILPADHIANMITSRYQNVEVKGLIADDPQTSYTIYKRYKTTFTLKVSACNTSGGWRDATGLARVVLYSRSSPAKLVYGDIVMMNAVGYRPTGLKNPGLFDYSEFLELNNIYAILKVKESSPVRILDRGCGSPVKSISYRLKHNIVRQMDKHFTQPALGFLKAVVVGDRSGLERTITDEFMKTGTIHIISVSGTHVALLACIIIFLLRLVRIPKKPAMAFTVAALVIYAFLAGLGSPILRSVIMFAIFALGYILDRETNILNSLGVAAFMILLWNPKELFDPSFQLSFGSIASIALITPAIDRLLRIEIKGRLKAADKARLYVLKAVSVSLAAWIGVAPIVAYYFNIASPVAVVANLIVVPVVSLLMIMSFAFLPLASLAYVAGAWAAMMTQIGCNLLFLANKVLAAIPFSYTRVAAPAPAEYVIYYVLLAIFLIPKPSIVMGFKITNKRFLILIAALVALRVWVYDLNPTRRDLEMDVLNVGKGDSILLRFPGKGTMLIDAGTGGDEENFDTGRSVVAPYLWNLGINRLDAVVVTHSHEDHLGGLLFILENFNIGCVIDNGISDRKNIFYKKYRDILSKKGIRRLVVRDGDMINGFDGVKIYILNPGAEEEGADDANFGSIVMKIVYGDSTALLTGDAAGPAIERISSHGALARAEILKIPHHGGSVGGESRVRMLFEAVSPEACIISSGELGHPDESVSRELLKENLISYETKFDGAIKAVLDGKKFTIKRQKQNN